MSDAVVMEASATYGESRPLEVLAELVEKRCKVLGELSADAVVATAINVLVSLRSATLKASPRRRTKVAVEVAADLVPSHFSHGGGTYRCIRNRAGARVDDNIRRARFVAGAGTRDRDLRVFRVTPEHANVQPYYVVARSAKDAARFEQAAARRRKEDYGGLAKTAMGIAMAKISTRNEPTREFRRRIEKSRIIEVHTSGGSGRGFELEIHDKLGYSIDALRGGRAEIDLAYKKAANKIAGRITQHLKKYGNLDDAIPTPFPEVKRRRSS